MLKKDNYILGALIGLVLPLILFGLLFLAASFVQTGTVWSRPFETHRMMLLALIVNVFPIRIYFVNYKMDKTGRGVLFMTFLIMVAYFLYLRYF